MKTIKVYEILSLKKDLREDLFKNIIDIISKKLDFDCEKLQRCRIEYNEDCIYLKEVLGSRCEIYSVKDACNELRTIMSIVEMKEPSAIINFQDSGSSIKSSGFGSLALS